MYMYLILGTAIFILFLIPILLPLLVSSQCSSPTTSSAQDRKSCVNMCMGVCVWMRMRTCDSRPPRSQLCLGRCLQPTANTHGLQEGGRCWGDGRVRTESADCWVQYVYLFWCWMRVCVRAYVLVCASQSAGEQFASVCACQRADVAACDTVHKHAMHRGVSTLTARNPDTSFNTCKHTHSHHGQACYRQRKQSRGYSAQHSAARHESVNTQKKGNNTNPASPVNTVVTWRTNVAPTRVGAREGCCKSEANQPRNFSERTYFCCFGGREPDQRNNFSQLKSSWFGLESGSGFQTKARIYFVPVKLNVWYMWRSQNVTIFLWSQHSHALVCSSFFGKTFLVTFWLQMSQMVTSSNMCSTNLFLFLFGLNFSGMNKVRKNIPESQLFFCFLFGIRIGTALNWEFNCESPYRNSVAKGRDDKRHRWLPDYRSP